jgi:hypothetical protein
MRRMKTGTKNALVPTGSRHLGPWSSLPFVSVSAFPAPRSAFGRLRRHTKSDRIKVKMNFCSEKGPENQTG